jgi:hypothetical protein
MAANEPEPRHQDDSRFVRESGLSPLEPLELPEGCEVAIVLRITQNQPQPSDPQCAYLELGLIRVYVILSHCYDGSPHAAARHNEHQP